MFVRHPLNNRVQDSVRARYVVGLLETGLVSGVRGQPWAMLSAGGKPPYRLLSFATLVEAVYDSHKLHPNNPMIMRSIAGGMTSVLVLNERMPADVCRHLKEIHNQYHGGSSTTIIETLYDCVRIQDEWAAYAKINNITSRGGAGEGTYIQKYEKFVNDAYPQKFNSYHHFNTLKILSNALRQRNLMKFLEVGC